MLNVCFVSQRLGATRWADHLPKQDSHFLRCARVENKVGEARCTDTYATDKSCSASWDDTRRPAVPRMHVRSRAVFTTDVGGGENMAGMKKEIARAQRRAWNETWQEGVDVDTGGYVEVEDDPLDAFAYYQKAAEPKEQ